MRTKGRTAVLAFVVVALVCAATATAAGAAPVWKFNSTELSGTETAVGAAVSSSLAIPGATTTCAHFLYNMKISNKEADGKTEITELPLYECTTNNPNCKVKSITAEKLPWPGHLTTIGSNDYIVIENVVVGLRYEGSLCSLAGGKVALTGDAGGVIENSEERATFDKATFETTKTKLEVGSESVEWNGVFTTEGFEKHRTEKLEG
jgi:hypothetical protein